MITIHAYPSWTEDNPKGYHQRGEHGVNPPDHDKANQRARIANDPPIHFNTPQQNTIIELTEDILQRRCIRLHALSITPTHLHFIASWFGEESIFEKIDQEIKQADHLASKTKNILSTLLSKQYDKPGTRWFSRGAGCTLVTDHEHLSYLMQQYLPKHVEEGGLIRIYGKGATS